MGRGSRWFSCRAIDNNRLVKGPLLRCPEVFMAEVDQALREVLELG